MNSRELEKRTKQFAIRCLQVMDAMPATSAGRAVANQLARCGTSVGANYRAAHRARSRAEWIAKLCIVTEECDDWLEIIVEAGLLPSGKIHLLNSEAAQLLAILTKARHTAKEGDRVKTSNRQVTKSPSRQIS